jgi:hypothetical protein
MSEYRFGIDIPPHRRWPVAWYNPFVLFAAAREMLSSFDMIRNADPREQFAGKMTPVVMAPEENGEFWFDFISDVGDGGNATYTVARAALADWLTVETPAGPYASPRGRLMVLGGDLAYPGASTLEYQYRFLEVYEGARPRTGNEQQKYTVLALAQNHDWFDSTSTFRRYFVDRNLGEFIGASTPQQATYFATRLPHRWWMLALDYALVGDIDRAQFEAFNRLIGDPNTPPDQRDENKMYVDDQVILLYPEPYWYRPLGDDATDGYPWRYQRLEALLEANGIRVRIRLAGDSHHYVRETKTREPAEPSLLLTCGSGGAFMHPTHSRHVAAPKRHDLLNNAEALSPELRLAVRVGTVDDAAHANVGERVAYPDPSISRALCRDDISALFKFGSNNFEPSWAGLCSGNILFALTLGALYWMAAYANSLPFSHAFEVDDFVAVQDLYAIDSWFCLMRLWFRALFFSPLALGVHVLLGVLCIAIAKEERGILFTIILPIIHFAAHIVAAATLFWWCAILVHAGCTDGMPVCRESGWQSILGALAQGTLMLISGTLVGGLIFGLYFAAMARLGRLANNAFSPLACEDYKGFLRFRIDREGNLHGHYFGCDRVPRKWVTNPPPPGRASGDARPAWQEAPGEAAAQWRLIDQFELTR